VLGLLFLRYADGRFSLLEKALQPKPGSRMGAPGPDAFKAQGAIYLTPEARFPHLLALPEGANLGRALNDAMEDIEKHNPDLRDEADDSIIFSSLCWYILGKKSAMSAIAMKFDESLALLICSLSLNSANKFAVE